MFICLSQHTWLQLAWRKPPVKQCCRLYKCYVCSFNPVNLNWKSTYFSRCGLNSSGAVCHVSVSLQALRTWNHLPSGCALGAAVCRCCYPSFSDGCRGGRPHRCDFEEGQMANPCEVPAAQYWTRLSTPLQRWPGALSTKHNAALWCVWDMAANLAQESHSCFEFPVP